MKYKYMKKLSEWKIFKPAKYTMNPKIKKELVDFLRWHFETRMLSLSKVSEHPANPEIDKTRDRMFESLIDDYCKENDIILVGELRKFHGANTRNAKAELCYALLAVIVAIVLSVYTCKYFL